MADFGCASDSGLVSHIRQPPSEIRRVSTSRDAINGRTLLPAIIIYLQKYKGGWLFALDVAQMKQLRGGNLIAVRRCGGEHAEPIKVAGACIRDNRVCHFRFGSGLRLSIT